MRLVSFYSGNNQSYIKDIIKIKEIQFKIILHRFTYSRRNYIFYIKGNTSLDPVSW
jgi:hypothetical protein